MPSLDGYIQDRLNNPIHLPDHGTLKTLRLEAPPPELVRRVVEARLRPALEQSPDFAELPPIFPFTPEQIERVARTEPTLRDMLQQFRHLFDHVVFGNGEERRHAAHRPGIGAGRPDEPAAGGRGVRAALGDAAAAGSEVGRGRAVAAEEVSGG